MKARTKPLTQRQMIDRINAHHAAGGHKDHKRIFCERCWPRTASTDLVALLSPRRPA